jgi:hypothetical protein
MLSVKEKLKPKGDRYTGNEYIEAWSLLPDDVETGIPGCMWKDRVLRFDVFRVLLYIIARREDPNIALEQVGEGICEDNILELLEDVLYFWTGQSRDEIREMRDQMQQTLEQEAERRAADPTQ